MDINQEIINRLMIEVKRIIEELDKIKERMKKLKKLDCNCVQPREK